MPIVSKNESESVAELPTVSLSNQHYKTALWFSLRLWYSKSSTVMGHGGHGQWTLSAFLTKVITGKLAEMAVVKFARDEMSRELILDVDVQQSKVVIEKDIVGVEDRNGIRKPKILLDIVGTNSKARYFLISESDFSKRRTECYALVMVELPRDHILRLVAPELNLSKDLRAKIGRLDEVRASLAGYIFKDEISQLGEIMKKGDWLTDPDDPKKRLTMLREDTIAVRLDNLTRTRKAWQKLISML